MSATITGLKYLIFTFTHIAICSVPVLLDTCHANGLLLFSDYCDAWQGCCGNSTKTLHDGYGVVFHERFACADSVIFDCVCVSMYSTSTIQAFQAPVGQLVTTVLVDGYLGHIAERIIAAGIFVRLRVVLRSLFIICVLFNFSVYMCSIVVLLVTTRKQRSE